MASAITISSCGKVAKSFTNGDNNNFVDVIMFIRGGFNYFLTCRKNE